jgi:hypothetical protein
LYEAFEDGKIDQKRLQNVFLTYLPPARVGKRLIYGLDATQIERPFSDTSPDRTAMPMHNIPHAVPKKSTPITFGWKYSTMTVLPDETSSWSYIMDQRRIPSDKTDIHVAFEQLEEIASKLSERPLILLDRGYVSIWFWCKLSGLHSMLWEG